MPTINELEARLNTHEEVCAVRYEGMRARLKRLEQLQVGKGAFVKMLKDSLKEKDDGAAHD